MVTGEQFTGIERVEYIMEKGLDGNADNVRPKTSKASLAVQKSLQADPSLQVKIEGDARNKWNQGMTV